MKATINLSTDANEEMSPFRSCIMKINSMFINDAKDLDIVMPMCSLFEYSDNCSDRKFVEMLQMQN